MTSAITWRSAILADRSLLQAFTCADKPVRNASTRFKPVHRKPWAYEVQSTVRALRPPVKPPRFMTVGLDDEGIVAVVYYTELDEELVHIELVAVAQRAHRQGIAAQLAEVVKGEIFDRWHQLGRDHLMVTAYVHPKNAESRAFCESAGAAVTGTSGTGYEVWAAEFFLMF